MKRTATFVLFLACLTASPSLAEQPQEMADAFFTAYIGGSGGDALDSFFAGNPLVSQKAQQIQLLKSQLTTVDSLYGAPFAYEIVSREQLAPSLERHVYITKHKHHPVTWEMYFYRPGKDWVPDQLLFVDQYQTIGSKK